MMRLTIASMPFLGTRLSLHASSLILPILVIPNARGYFTENAATGMEEWLLAGAFFLGFIASLLAHEYAHVLVARWLKVPCRNVVITGIGMMAALDEEVPSPGKEALIIAVGPLTNFLIAASLVGSLVVSAMTSLPPFPPLAVDFIIVMAMINVVLGVFNLIPCLPMDGGRLLRSLLWWLMRDKLRATRAAVRVGLAVAVMIAAYGVWSLTRGNFAGVLPIAIAWLMVVFARAELFVLSTRGELRPVGERVRAFSAILPDDGVPMYGTALRLGPVIDGRQRFGISRDSGVTVPIDEGSTIQQREPVERALQRLEGDDDILLVMAGSTPIGWIDRQSVAPRG